MPDQKLTRFLLLPKLELVRFNSISESRTVVFICKTNSVSASCPHCGTKTSTIHDQRIVTIQDAPHWDRRKILKIKKKRFRCIELHCKKVFTESIGGIFKRGRITERLKREVLYTCDNFANMKDVAKHTRLGNKTV